MRRSYANKQIRKSRFPFPAETKWRSFFCLFFLNRTSPPTTKLKAFKIEREIAVWLFGVNLTTFPSRLVTRKNRIWIISFPKEKRENKERKKNLLNFFPWVLGSRFAAAAFSAKLSTLRVLSQQLIFWHFLFARQHYKITCYQIDILKDSIGPENRCQDQILSKYTKLIMNSWRWRNRQPNLSSDERFSYAENVQISFTIQSGV